jgi:hypothetical protein
LPFDFLSILSFENFLNGKFFIMKKARIAFCFGLSFLNLSFFHFHASKIW